MTAIARFLGVGLSLFVATMSLGVQPAVAVDGGWKFDEVRYDYDGSFAFATSVKDGSGLTKPADWGTAGVRHSGGPLARVHLRPLLELLAPSGARGLSPLGGVIEHTGTNAAGGRIVTSTGAINQNDFAGIVNSGLTRGDDVHIFTGAHGLADGSLVTDVSLLADDVARFGDIPGVQVHDLPSMSPAQVQGILEGPGTIIGGFCDSGACLAGFGG